MSPSSPTVLAIDAGQTGVRLRLDGAQGSSEVTEFPGVRTAEPLAPQLGGYAARVLEAAGTATEAVDVAIGTSGVADVPGLALDLRAHFEGLGHAPATIAVAHDSVSSYLGALGERAGVVVAAGTGAIIFGVGPTATARVDGWGYLMGDDGSGFGSDTALRDRVMGRLREAMRPEFLNRIDETVVFHALDAKHIEKIAAIQLRILEQRLAKMDLQLRVSPAALEELAKVGFDPVFGARPLRRAIQRDLENPVSKLILEGRFGPKDVIPVDYEDGRFVFERVVH